MTRTRQFIYCFWIFVITMLLWQCYRYNQTLSAVDPAHPTQEHFFYYHTNSHTAVAAPVSTGPDVRQVGFSVKNDTPAPSSFTCVVTLQNKGRAKAIDVRVQVRPYRVVLNDDEGNLSAHHTDRGGAFAQFVQWISFPDLAPGESATRSAVFIKQAGAEPGDNASPRITFGEQRR